jgi:hypothetical protein
MSDSVTWPSGVPSVVKSPTQRLGIEVELAEFQEGLLSPPPEGPASPHPVYWEGLFHDPPTKNPCAEIVLGEFQEGVPPFKGFTPPEGPANPSKGFFGPCPGDWNTICRHPEHQAPQHICLRPGDVHIHVCPGCGASCYLTITCTPAAESYLK